jgi:outer membrane protein
VDKRTRSECWSVIRGDPGARSGTLARIARGPLIVGFAVLWVADAGRAAAQQDPGSGPEAPSQVWQLSLEEALEVAQQNNPAYLQVGDGVSSANWRVREAYGSLLPTVTTSGALSYAGAGQQLIGNLTGDDLGAGTTDYYLSSYSLGVQYSFSGATLYGLSSSRAERRAAEARLAAEGYDLESRVTVQYLLALRAAEETEAAGRQLARAEENLELAQARFEAGAVPGTDTRQAEVERGRAAVALVRAQNSARVERTRLLEEMGVLSDEPLELVSAFEVFEPTFSVDDLIAPALEVHPRLRSYREDERARGANVREAQSTYLPTLTLSAFWSGFTREIGSTSFLLARAHDGVASQQGTCEFYNEISAGLSAPLSGYPRDCGVLALTPEDERAILASNEVFPFNFEKQPLSLSARLSLPIFQGFSRQRQIEEASVQARAASHVRRAEELRLRTEVTTAHGNLLAAYEVVQIEGRNVELAGEQLELAQERYGLGAAPFLELLDAQNSAAIADRDYLNAVYDFHGAWVELQRSSGLELPSPGENP